jgi:hypothetical protein
MLIVGEQLGLADNTKTWLYFKPNYQHFFPSLKDERYKVLTYQTTI